MDRFRSLEWYEQEFKAAEVQADKHLLVANAGGLLATMSMAAALMSKTGSAEWLSPTMGAYFVGLLAAGLLPYLRSRHVLDLVEDEISGNTNKDYGTLIDTADGLIDFAVLRKRLLNRPAVLWSFVSRITSMTAFIAATIWGIGVVACS